MNDLLIIIHCVTTWYMTGVIWNTQLVQYPLFGSIDRKHFPEYHRSHVQRMGFVVIPAMLVELATAAILLVRAEDYLQTRLLTLGAALLAVIWANTFLQLVPLHTKLAAGFVPEIHHKLVRWNWLRTAAWTARAGLCFVLLGFLPSLR